MAETLTDRLRRRILSEPSVDLQVWPPIRPHPSVSAAELAEAGPRMRPCDRTRPSPGRRGNRPAPLYGAERTREAQGLLYRGVLPGLLVLD
jgi:hypothetical protein